MQWQLGAKWQFTAGVNLNETDYQYTDLFRANGDLSGQYGFETILSPRVAVNFLATPQIALHGSISHGFSPPSLSETLTPQGEINPDIRPETGYNFEIGSRGHLNQRRFFYDLTVYSMQIRNLLVARRTAEDAFVGINAGQSIHRGIELALQYQLVPEKPSGFVRQLQPFLNLNLADYTFGSFIDGESDFSGNQLTGVPQTTVAAGIDGQFAFGIYGNLNYLYTAEIPANDANTVFSDAYQVWNLRLGIRRTVARKLDFDLYGGIQNLGDEKYASMLMINALPVAGRPPRFFYPGLPRNYFAGLSVQYRWQ
jgi:iron complex outermembrane receptor protein